MTNPNGYVSDGWSADQWEAARARAAAYLATDPKWIVGPAVVQMYKHGRDVALAREQGRS